MKKLTALLLVFTLLFCFVSCTDPTSEGSETQSEQESGSLPNGGPSQRPAEGDDNTFDIGDLTDGM